jgi:hypothetical protein
MRTQRRREGQERGGRENRRKEEERGGKRRAKGREGRGGRGRGGHTLIVWMLNSCSVACSSSDTGRYVMYWTTRNVESKFG